MRDVYICATHLTFPARKNEAGDELVERSYGPGEEIPSSLWIERGIKSTAYIKTGHVRIYQVKEPGDELAARLEQGPSEEDQAAQDAARLEATDEDEDLEDLEKELAALEAGEEE